MRACRIIAPWRNVAVTVFDSIPAAIPLLIDTIAGSVWQYPATISIDLSQGTTEPLPTDDVILRAWNDQTANRCMRGRQFIVTNGSLNDPYETLGTVTATIQRSSYRDAARVYRELTGKVPTSRIERLHAVLIYKAREKYGDKVDALINFAITDREQSASGLAVRLIQQ